MKSLCRSDFRPTPRQAAEMGRGEVFGRPVSGAGPNYETTPALGFVGRPTRFGAVGATRR